METTSPTPPTSSGDASLSPAPPGKIPAGESAAEPAAADLLRADGSLIPVTREGDEPPPPESRPRFALRLRAWRSQTADRLASASPSQIALSAFAAGLVAGIVLGAASARR